MIKFLVDFMESDTSLVKFIHVYIHDDLNECFVAIYNDMTAKDRKWKNLDKLKAAVEG